MLGAGAASLAGMSRETQNRRIAVLGAAGRMGATAVEAVRAAESLKLVAVADPQAAGQSLHGLTMGSGVEDLLAASPQVVIDFTVAEAARNNLPVLANAGVHAVVGTSGLGDEDFVSLAEVFNQSACLVVPNFALGAVLMMRFAEMAAPWFDTAEIIEFHHDAKIDAPSGTAMATVDRMAAASADWAEDPTEAEVLPGARGGLGPADIRVHAVRMRGMVAHQEVLLGATGQSLSIRHDTTDRSSFMPGMVLAAQQVEGTGLTVGLDALLGI